MDELFNRILSLAAEGKIRISNHGYDELAEDGIFVREIINRIQSAELLEEYEDYPKGPCLLVLQTDRDGQPVHVVWGIPKGFSSPAVLITAYRPDPGRWSADFRRRLK